MNIGMKIGYAGYFRLHTTNSAGEITKDTGWFRNLITNIGLDFIGTCANNGLSNTHEFTSTCAVGTGNATPAFTDTNLQSFVASSDGGGSSPASYIAGSPPYWSMVRSWQFAAGVATGNIAELGTGPAPAGTNPPLFSRALVVDGGGSPTVIPVLSSEALTVTYELRQYIDVTDHTYSFALSGTTYSGTYRRANITTATNIATAFQFGIPSGIYGGQTLYNGSIGLVTSSPTGSSTFTSSGITISTYVSGNYYLSYSNSFSINQGNLSGGISAFLLSSVSGGSWQFSVSPSIPKTNSYAMTMNWTVSWSRYP